MSNESSRFLEARDDGRFVELVLLLLLLVVLDVEMITFVTGLVTASMDSMSGGELI